MSTYSQWVNRLNIIFSRMGTIKRNFTRLRYIDETGAELVSVEFSAMGKVIEKRDSELSTKITNPFLSDALKVEKNTIYISSVDVNYESELDRIPVIYLAVSI